MPIAMRCPGCDTKFEFASDLDGKRIKCKTCGDIFRVERPVCKARDDDRPPSRTRRPIAEDSDDGDVTPRKAIHPLLIVGLLLGLVLVIAVVVIVLASLGK